MSSVGQAVGGLVGGIVGFFAGGNVVLGAQIGMMIGGAIDPPDGPVINGPRLDDLSVQTSTYGAFIPRNYGTIAQNGNIFWLKGDKLTETPRKEESGGKGGPASTTNTWEYSATFALGLCEGPIDGVRRIWINGQLWYDAGSGDISTVLASNEAAALFTLYKGSDTQLPDPLMQADKGIANVPAYRGLAYIVFDNLPLAKYNNSLAGAQIKVEIIKNGTITDVLVERTTVAADAIFHSTSRAAGNQYDSGGGRNYVAMLNNASNAPYWIRQMGAAIETRKLADGGGVGAVTNSVRDVQYVYNGSGSTTNEQIINWGSNGGLASYDSGVGFYARSFADDGKIAYLIKGANNDAAYHLIKIPLHVSGRVAPEQAVSLLLNEYDPLLTLWSGKSVTVWRVQYDPLVRINIYDVVNGALALVDSAQIAAGDANFAINAATDSLAHMDGNRLIVAARILVDASHLLIFDLIDKTLLSTHVVPSNFTGMTVPFRGSMHVEEKIFRIGQRTTVDPAYHSNTLALGKISSSTVPLSSIVEAECLTSSLLNAADLDVTGLADPVRGYRIASLGALRGGIDPLRAAWPFDVVQSGYKIKFKRRGSSPVATINASELDARAAGDSPGVQITNSREMDTLLPSRLLLKYIDATREYDTNEQPSDRDL